MRKIILKKTNFLSLIIFSLFFLGLLLPTSLNHIISRQLEYLGWGILFILLLIYLLIQGSYNKVQLIIALFINISLWFFTLIAPFTQYSPGAYFGFLNFSLLICLNFKKPSINNYFRYLLAITSVLLLVGAYLVIFKTVNIDSLLTKYYTFGSNGTQQFMVDARKPVLMFGTHSIAAFYYFIFFWLNYHTFKVFLRNFYLLNAILFILAMILLRSVTGYGFAAISLLILGSSLLITPKRMILFFGVAIAIGILAFIKYQSLWEAIFNLSIKGTFSSTGNGFLGRYSSSSMLGKTISYIGNHPLQPIGFGYNDSLFYTDSGPVQYFLRGSVFLVIAIYLGALGLFINNIWRARYAFFLFFFFMIFELGYPNLIYMRTIYLMPFIITYFNFLKKYHDKSSSLHGGEACA